MDITPKPLKIPVPTVVINYDSKKNPGDIYQNVLKSLVDIVYAIEGKEMLEASIRELDEAKAVLENKLFAYNHPELSKTTLKKFDEPTAYKFKSTVCTCTKETTCSLCMNDYQEQLKARVAMPPQPSQEEETPDETKK